MLLEPARRTSVLLAFMTLSEMYGSGVRMLMRGKIFDWMQNPLAPNLDRKKSYAVVHGCHYVDTLNRIIYTMINLFTVSPRMDFGVQRMWNKVTIK